MRKYFTFSKAAIIFSIYCIGIECISIQYINAVQLKEYSVFGPQSYIQEIPMLDRQPYIQKISKAFQKNNIVALKGLPGMGKTTLARIFFKKYKHLYKKIYWINWDKLSFIEQLRRVTRSLKKHDECAFTSVESALAYRIKIFKEPVLLIIDSIKDIKNIKNLLNCLKNIKNLIVLVTTRKCAADIVSIDIGPFTDEESIQLITMAHPTIEKKRLIPIVKKLGNYPFYISKVSNILKKSPFFTAKRIEEMLESGQPLIISSENTENAEENVGKNVECLGEAAIKEKILEFKKEDKKVYDVLLLLSFLSAKTIPIDLIHYFCHSALEGDRILHLLDENAFICGIRKKDDFVTININQVMQSLIRLTASEADKKTILQNATLSFIEFYKNKFYEILNGDREDQIFYSHISSLLSFFKEELSTTPLLILMLKRSLYSQRSPENAQKIFVSIMKKQSHYTHKDPKLWADFLSDSVFMKGFLYVNDDDKFNAALLDGEEACKWYENIAYVDGICQVYTRMGWIHLYRGDTEKCAYYIKKAEEFFHNTKENYIRKEFYFTRGWYFLCKGEWDRCIKDCTEGEKIDKLSKNSYLGLYFLAHKGASLMQTGLYKEAMDSIQIGLSKEAEFFSENGTLARGDLLYIKASILQKQNHLKEAEKIILESLSVFEGILGSFPYYERAVALGILGSILEDQCRHEEAFKCYMQAKNIFDKQSSGRQKAWPFVEFLCGLCRLYAVKSNIADFSHIYSILEKKFDLKHPLIEKLQKWITEREQSHLLLSA